MRITELLDILRDYPQDWEVELVVVAPVDEDDKDITVERYTVDGVLPWNGDGDEKLLWLVGGEDDNVDAFLDAIGD